MMTKYLWPHILHPNQGGKNLRNTSTVLLQTDKRLAKSSDLGAVLYLVKHYTLLKASGFMHITVTH